MSEPLGLKKPFPLPVITLSVNDFAFIILVLEENKLFFIETSALDSSHVEEAFTRILEGKLKIFY